MTAPILLPSGSGQLAVKPSDLISGPNFLRSETTRLSTSAGVLGSGPTPNSAKRWRVSSRRRNSLVLSLSAVTMASGRPRGAKRPNHGAMSRSGLKDLSSGRPGKQLGQARAAHGQRRQLAGLDMRHDLDDAARHAPHLAGQERLHCRRRALVGHVRDREAEPVLHELHGQMQWMAGGRPSCSSGRCRAGLVRATHSAIDLMPVFGLTTSTRPARPISATERMSRSGS